MAPTFILFFIIFLEGYVILSAELLAIRLLVPFVGSGADTISIIIAAVLMPLAFGYYAGGQFKTRKNGKYKSTIRKKLLFNFAIAAIFLSLGLSHIILELTFSSFIQSCGAHARILLTMLYASLFLIYPVFLLGQTVPLISNYFPRSHLPVMTGRILFFSTLGSFMGSVFCTLILMSYAGVHYTATLTICCIAVLASLLSKKILTPAVITTICCALLSLGINNEQVMKHNHVIANNKYNLIQVSDFADNRRMKINRNASAAIDKKTGQSAYEYILYMERTFIDPTLSPSTPPIDILVLGAGGFTVGLSDHKNNYTYVDIDKSLKEIAEKELLKQKLSANKKFITAPARGFLYDNTQKFDLILIDTYQGPAGPPAHLVTKEFFEQIKATLKPNGKMAANVLTSPNFTDKFSIRFDNTIRSVFNNIGRQAIGSYDGWGNKRSWTNIIYSYYGNTANEIDIYTDNKNSAAIDKPSKI